LKSPLLVIRFVDYFGQPNGEESKMPDGGQQRTLIKKHPDI